MSNLSIYTEREMLKQMLDSIQEEKKVLRDMYQGIKNQESELLVRIREIDNMGRSETKGIYDVQGLISDLSETLSRVSELIPKVPIDVVLAELKGIYDKDNGTILLEGKDNKIFKNEEYQLSKNDMIYKENQNAISKRIREEGKKKKFNAKVHGGMLISFMKDKGRPVAISEISEYLSDMGFTEGNTSNRMTAMMKKHSKVSKVGHGYYQYIM